MEEKRLAVLIDAENIPSKYIKENLEEIAKHGIPTIKRLSGDWTRRNNNQWKRILLEYATKDSTNKRSSLTEQKPLTKINQNVINLITESVDEISDENGWVYLGELGNYLVKRQTDFDPRNYGFPRLFKLIKSLDKFEIDEKDSGVGNIRHI